MLSKKALQEFKEIWLEEIGEEISDELAMSSATTLLNAFDKIYRPIKRSNIPCSERSSASPLQKTS